MWLPVQLWRCGVGIGGVGRTCANIFAKTLAAAAGEKVRRIFAVALCTSTHAQTYSRKVATMGTQKKEKNRKERQGKTGDGMGNVKVKGENFYR